MYFIKKYLYDLLLKSRVDSKPNREKQISTLAERSKSQLKPREAKPNANREKQNSTRT